MYYYIYINNNDDKNIKNYLLKKVLYNKYDKKIKTFYFVHTS